MDCQLNTRENKNLVWTSQSEPTLYVDTPLSIILFGGGEGKLNLTSSGRNVRTSAPGCEKATPEGHEVSLRTQREEGKGSSPEGSKGTGQNVPLGTSN